MFYVKIYWNHFGRIVPFLPKPFMFHSIHVNLTKNTNFSYLIKLSMLLFLNENEKFINLINFIIHIKLLWMQFRRFVFIKKN